MGDAFNIPDIPENEKIQLYNACGQGLYIGRDPTNMELLDPICQPCPDNIQDNDPNVDMCSDDISVWLPAQQAANPSNRLITSNLWTDVNTVLTSGSNNDINQIDTVEDTIKDWYIDRMPDKVILNYMNRKGYFNEIEDDSERLDRFKGEVSGTRGSLIFCKEPSGVNNIINSINGEEIINLGENWNPNEIIDEENNIKMWDGCDDTNMFGPKNIIMEEIRDWESENNQSENNQRDNTVTTGSISEENIYGGITKGIMGLELLIISSSEVKVKKCMLDNLVLEDICEMSLSYKMLTLLNILFSTIGFNLELSSVNSDDPNTRQKLIMIIDELGDLIPRSLDKIIEISEGIEYDKCGKVSGRTHILKELQTVLFNPSKKSINLELPDIKNFLSEDYMSDNEFNRFAVIAGIGLAVFKFI